jgi:hypothetical protein
MSSNSSQADSAGSIPVTRSTGEKRCSAREFGRSSQAGRGSFTPETAPVPLRVPSAILASAPWHTVSSQADSAGSIPATPSMLEYRRRRNRIREFPFSAEPVFRSSPGPLGPRLSTTSALALQLQKTLSLFSHVLRRFGSPVFQRPRGASPPVRARCGRAPLAPRRIAASDPMRASAR